MLTPPPQAFVARIALAEFWMGSNPFHVVVSGS
jgi:hypothetical protein